MRVSVPAMRGEIGQKTYYATLMKLSAIPKMFTFTDWEEFTPEDREQRILNKKRVPDIAKYILDNDEGYLFSSITASYKCAVDFRPLDGSDDLGHLEMEFEEANFVINDGQHRCAAIAHAIKQNPSLGEESISVLLFEYESRSRVQQMFSDLNRFVAKTSKSLDILYDNRDKLARVTLAVCDAVPAFKDMVDKDAVSLPATSRKLFSLAALYDATEELLKPFANDDTSNANALQRHAYDFWMAVAAQMPDWERVKSGDMRAKDLRQENLSAHAVVLRAIGGAGADLLTLHPEDWKTRLQALRSIDWMKKNPQWENICVVAGSVSSNRQSRAATKALIKQKLGLPLTEAEMRSISAPTYDHTPQAEASLVAAGS
jgi:DNA sulfur modification protein DndB